VYSERGVPLPVFDIRRRMSRFPGMQNSTRVQQSSCDVTQTSDPANPPPCACRTRLRDVCSTRPIRTVGPEPLYPHVCGPHVALEVGYLNRAIEARNTTHKTPKITGQVAAFISANWPPCTALSRFGALLDQIAISLVAAWE